MEERHWETGGKPAESLNYHLSYLFVRHYCVLLIHYYTYICLWATALSFKRKQTHQIYTALETDHSSRLIPGKQWELMLTTETLFCSQISCDEWALDTQEKPWLMKLSLSLFIYLTSVSVSDQPADNNKEKNLTKTHSTHISHPHLEIIFCIKKMRANNQIEKYIIIFMYLADDFIQSDVHCITRRTLLSAYVSWVRPHVPLAQFTIHEAHTVWL